MIEKILNALQERSDYLVGMFEGDGSKEDFMYLYKIQEAEYAKEIVQEVAKEYGKDTNVRSNGWIPCSERLPEEHKLVLIYAESTARGGSIRRVAQLHNGFWFVQTASDTLGLIGQYNVIKWAELPEV